ncbi:MAG TPA: TMEM165/GDT1 family protein [Candidatus Obscuribacterales bacterium]
MLTAFTAGLSLITVSELGDKTFFIAAILAMRHPRRWVFTGAVTALALMTILSVLLGQTASLVPKALMHFLEVALLAAFGLKLLYDASQMPAQAACDEAEEAMNVVKEAEAKAPKRQTWLAICIEAFTLTFVAEWGDRTQFATIFLSAANNPIGVTLGAILGHAICAAIAVFSGRLICERISERVMTALGGMLFLIFAGVAWLEGSH